MHFYIKLLLKTFLKSLNSFWTFNCYKFSISGLKLNVCVEKCRKGSTAKLVASKLKEQSDQFRIF